MHDLVVPDEAAGFSPPGCEAGMTAEEVKSGKAGGVFHMDFFACFYTPRFT